MWAKKDCWSVKLLVDWWVNTLVVVMVAWLVELWVLRLAVAMGNGLDVMKVNWMEMMWDRWDSRSASLMVHQTVVMMARLSGRSLARKKEI